MIQINNLHKQFADYNKGPTSLGKRNADTSSSKKGPTNNVSSKGTTKSNRTSKTTQVSAPDPPTLVPSVVAALPAPTTAV
jgi:hypothetical protein